MWKGLDIYINAENLTDRRQSRWENIYTGTMANPVFKDVYTPIEGVMMNAGIKIKLAAQQWKQRSRIRQW